MSSRQSKSKIAVDDTGERDASAIGRATPARDNQRVEALDRGLMLLQAFRRGDRPLGNAELAARLRLPKPTVSRLAYTLVEAGFLTFDRESRRYALGPSAIAVGCTALANIDMRSTVREPLEQLARETSLNVGLGVRDRLRMMFIDVFEGDALVGMRIFAGARIPLVSSAMGRAYLAGLPEAERASELALLEREFGGQWSAIGEKIEAAVASVRERGFCASVGDWRSEISGVAAPIRLEDGRIYAINVGGPSYLIPQSQLFGSLAKRIVSIAREIERSFATGDGADWEPVIGRSSHHGIM